VDHLDEIGCEWCGGGVHHAQGAEAVFCYERVFGEGRDDGWDYEGECDLLVLDDAAELLELEALHYVDCDAFVDCLQEEHSDS